MFGNTIFENPQEHYVEYVLAEEQNLHVRIVVCEQNGHTMLYRVEWPYGETTHHSAHVQLSDAINLFSARIAERTHP